MFLAGDCTFPFSDWTAEQDSDLWFVCPGPSTPVVFVCFCFFVFFSLSQYKMSKGFLAWEQGCSTATIFHVLLRCAFSSLLLRVLPHGPEKRKKKKKKRWSGCCLGREVSFSPRGVEDEMARCSLATLVL